MTGQFQLIHGGGDMLSVLDETAELVRNGTLAGLVICGVSEGAEDTESWWRWAHREGMTAAWARLVASVAGAQHGLIADGLTDDET